MSKNINKPRIFLLRHGETAWSKSGQHTSYTDLELTEKGKEEAKKLNKLLNGISFTKVYVSPLLRAKQTCTLAGLMTQAEIDQNLTEWNYGPYEGLTTPEIRKTNPNWSIFTNGAPDGGESVEDVQKRASSVVKRLKQEKGNVAVFSSGHFSRALASLWLDLPVTEGKHFILGTGTISILSYERENPAIELWNSPSLS